jgi:hypothetical protein
VIGEVRAQGLSDAHLKAVAGRGGTSLGAALGIFVLAGVANVVLDTLLDVLYGLMRGH